MKHFFKIFFLSLFPFLIFLLGYLAFEPELIKGATATASVSLTQTVVGEITLSCDNSVSGLTTINGMTGGTSNGYFNCTSTTNNVTGYNLTLKKTGLLCHTTGCGTNKQFDDYPGTTTDPIDFNFQAPGTDQEWWGFNIASTTDTTDVTQRFKDNGTACNAGTNVTDGKCWVRVPTDPTVETIANRSTQTSPQGTRVTVGIRIQAGGSNSLQSGNYTTTLVLTATTN